MVSTFVNRYPRLIIAVYAVLVVFGGVFAARIPEAISIMDQLDRDLPETRELRSLRHDFNDAGMFGFLIDRPISGWNQKAVCQIHFELQREIMQFDRIRSFQSALQVPIITHDGARFQLEETADQCSSSTVEKPFNWHLVEQSAWKNLFLGKDGSKLAFYFQLNPLADNEHDKLEWLPKFVAQVDTAAGESAQWFGNTLQEWEIRKGGQFMQIINLLIVISIFLFMRMCFGTWRSALLFWLTVVCNVAIVYGGFQLTGGKQDMIFLCLFMLMVVASLEDFVFITLDPNFVAGRIDQAFKAQAMPAFLTSFTTMIGFASLMISELHPIRLFGGWAAAGAMLEWAAVFLLLPALLRTWPRIGSWIHPGSFAVKIREARWMKPVVTPLLTLATFAVFMIPFASRQTFNVTQDPSRMFDQDHVIQKGIRNLTESRGWISSVEAVFARTASPDLEKQVLHTLSGQPLVQEIDSFQGVFDSVTREIHDPALNRALVLPVKMSPAGKRYFAPLTGQRRAFIYLNSLDVKKILSLKKVVTDLCPDGECTLGGDLVAFAEYSNRIISTLFHSFFLSLVLVGLVLVFTAYSRGMRWNTVPVLISAFWGPFAVLFIIWIANIEVNFVTCILLSVLVGLTGDNAIQYLYGSATLDEGAQVKGGASLICAVQMAGVGLLFLLSPFEPARGLGVLLALGFGLSFFGDYFLLRSLLGLRIFQAPAAKRSIL